MAAHRTKLVAAGLTIMRAFAVAGVPPEDVVLPWGRFERWSAMVRAPLVWLGRQDPCAALKELERDDPARLEHLQVLVAWRQVYGDEPKTAREVAEDAARTNPDSGAERKALRGVLRELVANRAGEVDTRRLGNWLRAHAGRLIEGFQIEKDGDNRDGVARWFVSAPEERSARAAYHHAARNAARGLT
jgi:putative DNA primase/helicase